MDSHTKRKRIRRVLRDTTHYKNTTEFFTAVLFECGAPPHPITMRDISNHFPPIENSVWRTGVGTHMSVRLHHSIDPSFMTQEFLKWLLRQQESNHISRRF